MSYDFAAAGSKIKGQLTTAIDHDATGLTIACWIKQADSPAANQEILNIAESETVDENNHNISDRSTADQYGAESWTLSGNSAVFTASAGEHDGNWIGIVGTFTSTILRDLYVNVIGDTATSTPLKLVDPVSWVIFGQQPGGGAQYTSLSAEGAVWNIVLTTQQITDFLAGDAASTIQAANLRGYWPLSADSGTQTNLGLDATGDLTVTNAVFDADHPTITGGGPVIITDVDGDEAWNDGDTGLVITGTGFV